MHFKKVTTKITYGGIVKAHILRSDEKKKKSKKKGQKKRPNSSVIMQQSGSTKRKAKLLIHVSFLP